MVSSKKLYWVIFLENLRLLKNSWFAILLVLALLLISVDTIWYESEYSSGTVIELVNNETMLGTKKVALVQLDSGGRVKVELPQREYVGVNSKVILMLKRSKISRRLNFDFIEVKNDK